jgi:hypothetical protein
VHGIVAVTALDALRANRDDSVAKRVFEQHKADLGFGLLLKKYVVDVSTPATPAMIERAVNDTVPRVTPCSGPSASWWDLGFAMLAAVWPGVLEHTESWRHAAALAAEMGAVDAARPLDCLRARAGLLPSTAASRGRFTACCPHTCRFPR